MKIIYFYEREAQIILTRNRLDLFMVCFHFIYNILGICRLKVKQIIDSMNFTQKDFDSVEMLIRGLE